MTRATEVFCLLWRVLVGVNGGATGRIWDEGGISRRGQMVEGGSSDGVLGSARRLGEHSRWVDERLHKTILPLVLSLSWSQEPHHRWSLLGQTVQAGGPRVWAMAVGWARRGYLLVWSSQLRSIETKISSFGVSCVNLVCFKDSQRVHPSPLWWKYMDYN